MFFPRTWSEKEEPVQSPPVRDGHPSSPASLQTLGESTEEHSMDRCWCRPELSERVGGHWSVRISGKSIWTNRWVPLFQVESVWTNGPDNSSKFPPGWPRSMDGSSQENLYALHYSQQEYDSEGQRNATSSTTAKS